MQPNTVNVLLIDDDEGFNEVFRALCETALQGIDYNVETRYDVSDSDRFVHDIYVVDNRIYGVEKVSDIVSQIKASDRDATIFVVSGFANFDLLKRLFRMGIAGFIDKDNIEMDGFREAAIRSAQKRDKIQSISAKLHSLNMMYRQYSGEVG